MVRIVRGTKSSVTV